MEQKVDSCVIRHEPRDMKVSDHWPVTLDVAIDLSGGYLNTYELANVL